MRKFLTALVAIILPMTVSASAADILGKAVANLHKSKSVTATYSIASGGEKTSGTITAEGSMFKISSKTMQVWYDGKTQWTYMPAEKEVDITEPTAAELQQVNPFAIIDSHAKLYNARELKSTVAGKSAIELIPKNKKNTGGISKAVLTLDKKTLLPEKVVITMSSRSVVTITISSINGGGSLGVASFRPSSSQFKGVEIVDLR